MATEAVWMTYCQVGTDNTAPTQSQTALVAHHAGASDIQSTTNGQEAAAPYFGWKRRTYRFAAGTVAANLSEAGIGWGAAGSTLISRALILDPVTQTPTTITPLIDEILDVTYELRYYPPLVDVTSPQVTLAGVLYDTITRAAVVTGDKWSALIGDKIDVIAGLTDWRAYDGNLGTLEQNPSGTSADSDSTSQASDAYVNNSYEISMNCPVGSTGWNLGAGIRSVRIHTTAGAYQTQFDAASGGATVPKTTSYTMTMGWTISWSEKP